MSVLRFLFAPEFHRCFGGAGRGVAALPGPLGRIILLSAAVLAVWAAATLADAQTFDPGLFASADREVRELLAFVSDFEAAGSTVLGDMFFVFNSAVLLLAGALLIWHTVAGSVETAREGRLGFGAWEIVRIVTSVALMAPLPGGPNGAQHIVIGLANLGGDIAAAVWRPFATQALDHGETIIPRPRAPEMRQAIARVLVAETCLHAANGIAAAAGDPPYVARRSSGVAGGLNLHYDGVRSGMPANLCGVVHFSGLDAEGARGIAARGHREALESLYPQLRAYAAEFGSRYVPASPAHNQSLPDIATALDRSGLAESYGSILDVALRRAATQEKEDLTAAIATDMERSSWLAAASFFNTIAARTGTFQSAAHNLPSVNLPLPSLKKHAPEAAVVVKTMIEKLGEGGKYQAIPFGAAAGATGGAADAAPLRGGFLSSLWEFMDLSTIVVADSGNPIADLTGMGHNLLNSSIAVITGIAAVAAGTSVFDLVPFFGAAVDVFEEAWPVVDGIVTLLVSVLLIAGVVLAYFLPAIPFLRFLFSILGWIVAVVEALLAVTIFCAAHITRGDGNTLATQATRQGWHFLAALVLRPPLMLLGLILGYFVFVAIIGLFNEIWLPRMRDANAADGLNVVDAAAMLVLYVMVVYALINSSFKLIDLLPNVAMEWIGGRGGYTDDGADRLGGTAAGGAARLGGIRLPARVGRTRARPGGNVGGAPEG